MRTSVMLFVATMAALSEASFMPLRPRAQPLASAAREISVDASIATGKFKNLQGTNSCNASGGLDEITDMLPAIAELWPSYGIKNAIIYVWPEVFLGWGKNGSAGNPSLNENYDWTKADKLMSFVTSHGATASIQFNSILALNDTISSPEILGEIGYQTTMRYMKGAHNSGFRDAVALFDFFAERDIIANLDIDVLYQSSFRYYAGFAKGVARANTTAGVGAWGGNRIFPTHHNYTLYDPFVSRFYADCKNNSVPIKAATFHFTNAQFSLDPYDIKRLTDRFRAEILVPAGFPNLPVWVTEFNLNPSGVLPTSEYGLQQYNDPAFYASFHVGTTMYAQDTAGLEQTWPWPGFGYGGYGAGKAWFPAWFNQSTTGSPVELNIAAAWKLQGDLVVNTNDRLALSGSSPDGFAALAGRSASKGMVQVLLNNYQPDYTVAREIAAAMAPLFNTTTTANPVLQPNGLFNGEQACFKPGTQFGIPVCQTYAQANVRNNTSTAYRLKIDNLPWDLNATYKLTIQRVGGGKVSHLVQNTTRQGNTIDVTILFPPNAQDLVTIIKM